MTVSMLRPPLASPFPSPLRTSSLQPGQELQISPHTRTSVTGTDIGLLLASLDATTSRVQARVPSSASMPPPPPSAPGCQHPALLWRLQAHRLALPVTTVPLLFLQPACLGASPTCPLLGCVSQTSHFVTLNLSLLVGGMHIVTVSASKGWC